MQQWYFEEGENTGHLLAVIALAQQAKSRIDAIQTPTGAIVHGSDRVASVFGDYFEDMYTSKVSPTEMKLADFLDQYPLPALSVSGSKTLNVPITVEELTEAVASMANSKYPTPGQMVSQLRFIKDIVNHSSLSYWIS